VFTFFLVSLAAFLQYATFVVEYRFKQGLFFLCPDNFFVDDPEHLYFYLN